MQWNMADGITQGDTLQWKPCPSHDPTAGARNISRVQLNTLPLHCRSPESTPLCSSQCSSAIVELASRRKTHWGCCKFEKSPKKTSQVVTGGSLVKQDRISDLWWSGFYSWVVHWNLFAWDTMQLRCAKVDECDTGSKFRGSRSVRTKVRKCLAATESPSSTTSMSRVHQSLCWQKACGCGSSLIPITCIFVYHVVMYTCVLEYQSLKSEHWSEPVAMIAAMTAETWLVWNRASALWMMGIGQQLLLTEDE